jgi:hypothetical protein
MRTLPAPNAEPANACRDCDLTFGDPVEVVEHVTAVHGLRDIAEWMAATDRPEISSGLGSV